MPTDPIQLSYLAGIIDGEGYIGITKVVQHRGNWNWSHAVRLVITNTDPRLMDWLMKIGGHLIARKVKAHWKPAWNWQITGGNAYDLLKAIRPYLLLKGEQADIAIALQELKIKGRRPTWGRQLTTEQVEQREALMQNIIQLNSRKKA